MRNWDVGECINQGVVRQSAISPQSRHLWAPAKKSICGKYPAVQKLNFGRLSVGWFTSAPWLTPSQGSNVLKTERILNKAGKVQTLKFTGWANILARCTLELSSVLAAGAGDENDPKLKAINKAAAAAVWALVRTCWSWWMTEPPGRSRSLLGTWNKSQMSWCGSSVIWSGLIYATLELASTIKSWWMSEPPGRPRSLLTL